MRVFPTQISRNSLKNVINQVILNSSNFLNVHILIIICDF